MFRYSCCLDYEMRYTHGNNKLEVIKGSALTVLTGHSLYACGLAQV